MLTNRSPVFHEKTVSDITLHEHISHCNTTRMFNDLLYHTSILYSNWIYIFCLYILYFAKIINLCSEKNN